MSEKTSQTNEQSQKESEESSIVLRLEPGTEEYFFFFEKNAVTHSCINHRPEKLFAHLTRSRGEWFINPNPTKFKLYRYRKNNYTQLLGAVELEVDDHLELRAKCGGPIFLQFDGQYIRLSKQKSTKQEKRVWVDDLEKKYTGDNTILKGITFQVYSGEFIAIIGPSGCGKSSLLEEIVGLGSCPETMHGTNGYLAYMPQKEVLHPELTVKQALKSFYQLRFKSPKEFDLTERVKEVLTKLELYDKRNSLVSTLSGGERKRAALGCHLLKMPKILVVDEPTAGLDPDSERRVMKILRRISEQDCTVICTTHVLDNIHLCDKVLALASESKASPGEIAFFGDVAKAKKYFKKERISSILQELSVKGKTHIDRWQQGSDTPKSSVSYQEKPESDTLKRGGDSRGNTEPSSNQPNGSANAFIQFLEYFKRIFLLHRGLWSSTSFFKRLLHPLFLQLVLQPVVIGCTIKLAGYSKIDAYSTDFKFFVIIAMFWLGMTNSVRLLVSERVPHRCLERISNIGLGSYITAKLFYLALIVLFQASFLYLIVDNYSMYTRFFISGISESTSSTLWLGADTDAFPLAIIAITIMWCAGFLASLIGLAISAACREESAALSFLPVLLIPLLFFSDLIVGKEGSGDALPVCMTISVYSPANSLAKHWLKERAVCSESTPSTPNGASSTQDSTTTVSNHYPALVRSRLHTCKLMTIYVLILLVMIFYLQAYTEKKWKGR